MSVVSKNLSHNFNGEELEVLAYNVIRHYMRDFQNEDISFEVKGAYVQGIVDYQSALFSVLDKVNKAEKEE